LTAAVGFKPDASPEGEKMNKQRVDEVLSYEWSRFLGFIRTCSEDEAKALLDAERVGACRRVTLMRLHQRFNVLRGRREREELGRVGMRTR
jgi:hypothetical protein